jgi:single-strand DNA-binding protein
MLRGLNKVMIIGTLERDPEMRLTPQNRPVTSFSVATTHDWLSSEGAAHQETEWFNVVAWGDLARQCHSRLQKGDMIYVEGRLKTRSWEDPAGKRHYRTEIVAREVLSLNAETHPPHEPYRGDEGDYPFEA